MTRYQLLAEIEAAVGTYGQLAGREFTTYEHLTAAGRDRQVRDQTVWTVLAKAFGADDGWPIGWSNLTAPVNDIYSSDYDRDLVAEFRSEVSERVTMLRSVRESAKHYDDPLPTNHNPEDSPMNPEDLGLDDEMVDMLRRLSKFPSGVEGYGNAGISLESFENDQRMRSLIEDRYVADPKMKPRGDGRIGWSLYRLKLTAKGRAALAKLDGRASSSGSTVINQNVTIEGDNYGTAATQAGGDNAAQSINVDATVVSNDIDAFVEALSRALDAAGNNLAGDDRDLLTGTLADINEERSDTEPRWERIRRWVIAAVKTLRALDPDHPWKDAIEAGETALEHLPELGA